MAAVFLSPPLAKWKDEIEQRDGGKVVVVRVFTDAATNTMTLPEDTEGRPVLRRFFLSEDFRGQLSRAHAFTVNTEGTEGKFHVIMLNMALAEQWERAEDAVLAREFSHIWLDMTGYPLLKYTPGPDSCLAIQASEVVQHILMRREMKLRGIDYLPYWLPNLDRSLHQLERQGREPAPACQRLAQLALWIDVRLGLTAEEWSPHPLFLAAMRKNYPALAPYADEISKSLEGLSLTDPDQYRKALDFSLEKFTELFNAHLKPRLIASLAH